MLFVWKSGTGLGLLPESGWIHPKGQSRRLSDESCREGMSKRMEVSALNPEGFQELWGCGFSGRGVCQRAARCSTFAGRAQTAVCDAALAFGEPKTEMRMRSGLESWANSELQVLRSFIYLFVWFFVCLKILFSK